MRRLGPTFIRSNARQLSGGRAFTLIEVLVVLVIAAVIMGIAAPRLAAISGGKTRTAAAQCVTFLSAVAGREQLSSQPICIEYDSETGRLEALSRRSQGASDEVADWSIDPLIPGVDLSETPPVELSFGDEAYEVSRFRVDLRSVSPRPTLRLVIRGSDTMVPAMIVLPGGRMTARIAAADESPDADAAVRVDLDEAGRGNDAW